MEVRLPKESGLEGVDFEEERSESTSSSEHYEHNVDNLAVEVVGQNWSREAF